MTHNVVTLLQAHFNVRITLGGCVININGETFDCAVTRDSTNPFQPTYFVHDKATERELCTFRPYHLHGGPRLYQVEGASTLGGDATLVVPEHGLLDNETAEPAEQY